MPVYDYRCPSCSIMVAEYRTVEDRANGPICSSCGTKTDKVISAPSMVIPDIQPYKAVAGDQRWIHSRAEHRQFLRENGLEEVGNEGKPETLGSLDASGRRTAARR